MMQNTKGIFYSGLMLIFPAALLITGWLYIRNSGLYFLHSVDPEFAYLFNGVTLAHLHPDLNCVGHPGTPIQVLIALVSWVVHWFRPGQPLWDDVLKNPEIYIHSALYVGDVINAVVLFFCGRYAFNYSRNLVVALVLQMAPFMHTVVLECTGRLIPEMLMPAILCGWVMLLIKMIYDNAPHNYKRYSLLFGLLFGFSMADKLTFLPFFLLPFILIPAWKLRLRFVLISMAAFMVFAFPVMFSIPKFVRWVTLIFTHKGVYGSGERGIIDWEVFIRNLEGMWDASRMLIIPFGILAVAVILFIVRNRRNKPFSATSVRIFLALSSVLLLQYFITAKHYALYYMTPSLLLSTFIVFMIFLFLGLLFPGLERKKVFTLLLGIFGLWFVFSKTPQVVHNLNHRLEATVIKTEAYKKIAPFLKATPKIICPNYYGCSSVEYALTFGLHESGKHAHYIFERMEKLYPCTYMYFLWGNVFYEGYKTILPASFMQPSATYTLYIADYSQEQLNQVLANMQTILPGYTFDLTKLYYSPSTTEAVFLLKVKDADCANEPVKKMNQ